jgi:tetratricopeptide (TPR) repeat protein
MGARVVFLTLAVCWLAVAARAEEADAPSPGAEAQAAERFRRGIQLFDAGDFAPALVEFERAYELSPHYRVLENIGVVNIRLGRYADAARALQRYLDEGGDAIAAERRAQVETELGAVALRTATLTLEVLTAVAEVTLDGRKVPASEQGAPIVVDAGEHIVEASADGFRARSYTLKLASQEKARIEVALEPLPRALAAPSSPAPLAPLVPQPQRRVFWPGVIGSATLAAGALTSVAIMARARSELTALKDDAGSPASARQAASQRANLAALTTDVLTALAIAGGGVTLYLSLRKKPGESAPRLALGPRHVALSWQLR